MKNQLHLPNVKTLAIIALSTVAISCSSEDQLTEETDVNAIQEGTNVPISDNLSGACSTRVYTFTRSKDVNKRVSPNIDDRSCSHDYSQTVVNGKTYGLYRLSGNNDSSDRLQTRIERQSRKVTKIRNGNFIRVSGTCRIRAAGSGDKQSTNSRLTNNNGTYIIQAKGKHTGGGGSPDPAVCLYVAKPITVNGQRHFDIYREQVKERGGTGTGGRILYGPLKRVKADTDFFVSITNGFETVNGRLRHYVDSNIGGARSRFYVKDTFRAVDAKIRFGAYRCKGGRADILWRNMGVGYNNN